jgi:hypothetical protein
MSDKPNPSDETPLQRRERHSREAVEAVADHAAKARAVDDKTARLKAQRLAKEAVETGNDRALSNPSGGTRKAPRPPKLIANCEWPGLPAAVFNCNAAMARTRLGLLTSRGGGRHHG